MVETTAARSLLLTRPAAQSAEFLAQLTALAGEPLPAVVSPLSQVVPTGAAIPPAGALVFTSGRAVELAGDLTGRRAWCVGDRTAALAAAAGAVAVSAGGDAEALARRLLRDRPADLVHLRGREVAGDLAGRLRAAGVPMAEVVLYETADLPLSDEARSLVEHASVLAPVFSPRSAARLAAELGPLAGRLVVAAISAATAAPLAAARVAVAEAPDASAMARLTLRLWADLP